METTAGFKDRKGILTLFGVILFLMGALTLLMALVMVLSLAAQKPVTADAGRQIPPSSFLLAVLCYGALSAMFIALGIGSILLKRWARTLTLLLSWITFIGGFAALVPVYFMPSMIQQIDKRLHS